MFINLYYTYKFILCFIDSPVRYQYSEDFEIGGQIKNSK